MIDRSAAARQVAFALDGLIRSRTKGHGGEEFARERVEFAEQIMRRYLQRRFSEARARVAIVLQVGDDAPNIDFLHRLTRLKAVA